MTEEMKELKDIREGRALMIESESTINYYIRGENKCYTADHKRYSWLDRHLLRSKKVMMIKLQA
jgi:hypothetical protein